MVRLLVALVLPAVALTGCARSSHAPDVAEVRVPLASDEVLLERVESRPVAVAISRVTYRVVDRGDQASLAIGTEITRDESGGTANLFPRPEARVGARFKATAGPAFELGPFTFVDNVGERGMSGSFG